MAEKFLIMKDTLTSIADGFRSSRGLTEELSPARMAELAAEGGGGVTEPYMTFEKDGSKLVGVSFHNTEWIPENMCYEQKNLTDISFENSPNLHSIGKSSFNGCKNLTSITIPNGVTSLGQYAFRYCSALKNVVLPPSLTSLNAAEVFGYCSALESINVNYLETFGSQALSGTNIETLDFPSLKKLGGFTFYGMNKLTTLIIRSSNLLPLTDTQCFRNTPYDTNGTGGTVYVPQALIESYKTAQYWSDVYATGNCNFVAIEGSEYE